MFLKRFHCDPHPGNFAFRADGSMIIYDFGGVKTLSNDIITHFKSSFVQVAKLILPPSKMNLLLWCTCWKRQISWRTLQSMARSFITSTHYTYDFAENSAHHDGMKLVKNHWNIGMFSSSLTWYLNGQSNHFRTLLEPDSTESTWWFKRCIWRINTSVKLIFHSCWVNCFLSRLN